jgi:8-amino-7-oxononanoate synthase
MRGAAVDFTSALYLGQWHGSASLRPWDQLTTGIPAALISPPGAPELAARLAQLQGCEQAVLGPSTLHLIWDLFGMLPCDRVVIYLDVGTYPVARWGVERAAARGVPVRTFPHHDPDALRRRMGADLRRGRRPLVVTDGSCPDCGRAAPLSAYLECVRSGGGRLILDDTQALGILGRSPRPTAPYGEGGGGSLRRSGVAGPDVVAISSLAKGFGAPMAVLAGGNKLVSWFEAASETRAHSSPPSAAVIRAAEHALAVNGEWGDALRLRLAGLVARFRNLLEEVSLSAAGGLFPVQTLRPVAGVDAVALHGHLLRLGVRAVLRRGGGTGKLVSFLITARHRPPEIDRAVEALILLMRGRKIAVAA